MAHSRGSGRPKKLKPPRTILVKSKTYGKHERAARGTVTPAKLNESMKAHGERMIKSNMPARLIFDALAPFRTDCGGGQLWQGLVKHFAAQAKQGMEYSVLGLEHMDLYKYSTIHRIMWPHFNVEYHEMSSSLEMSFTHEPAEMFLKRVHYVDGFHITIIVLFPDFRENTILTNTRVLPPRALEETIPIDFFMEVPPGATQCLIGFKVEGTRQGKRFPDSQATRSIYFSHALKFTGR